MQVQVLRRITFDIDPEDARDAAQSVIDRWNRSADSDHTGKVSSDELLRQLDSQGDIELPDIYEFSEDVPELLLTPDEWFEELTEAE